MVVCRRRKWEDFSENINYWYCVHPLWMKAKIYLQKTIREATLNSKVQSVSMLFRSLSWVLKNVLTSMECMFFLIYGKQTIIWGPKSKVVECGMSASTNHPANISLYFHQGSCPTSCTSFDFFSSPLPAPFFIFKQTGKVSWNKTKYRPPSPNIWVPKGILRK